MNPGSFDEIISLSIDKLFTNYFGICKIDITNNTAINFHKLYKNKFLMQKVREALKDLKSLYPS